MSENVILGRNEVTTPESRFWTRFACQNDYIVRSRNKFGMTKSLL